ncbi:MAG: sigma-70 family RNA polymerase sigma factor [Flavobacteriales bacterium]|nr:sigma-70 family RNA polymerase sigma factor [Flavobacteriales bacterium]MBP6642584.1 sigma-70 family RNA polymerase sigma factor [Flavobacteriales bacterium]MBP7156534.1 sigma-70 family RNA polymerase sigma factor [Flavobacteriales bacterium]HQV74544.1 sigma-70 family RNA polymerase sigma factor [Flavobacteriales bacterium]HQW39884.1 sigma-70 family RNA polymerase sigma factor [Flavobacteriales bacterium]
MSKKTGSSNTPTLSRSESDISSWVDKYTQDLLRYTKARVKDLSVAEDLVQITFVAAWEGRERYAGQSSIRTWLFSILKNKLADHYRKAYRDPVLHRTEELEIERFADNGGWLPEHRPTEWSMDALQEAELLEEHLAHCLQGLPPHWRAAIEMKYLRNVDAKEICQELGISVTNYWQQIHRAKLKLRDCITNQLQKRNH